MRGPDAGRPQTGEGREQGQGRTATDAEGGNTRTLLSDLPSLLSAGGCDLAPKVDEVKVALGQQASA
jgi:hypothetical protein